MIFNHHLYILQYKRESLYNFFKREFNILGLGSKIIREFAKKNLTKATLENIFFFSSCRQLICFKIYLRCLGEVKFIQIMFTVDCSSISNQINLLYVQYNCGAFRLHSLFYFFKRNSKHNGQRSSWGRKKGEPVTKFSLVSYSVFDIANNTLSTR